MRTLIPEPASAVAHPRGRLGRAFGFGLTPLALILFAAGFLLAVPAFFHARRIGFMLAWDGFLLAACFADAFMLPAPQLLRVTRTFRNSPQLGEPTSIELALSHNADRVLDVRAVDDLHPALTAMPAPVRAEVFPREPATGRLTVFPTQRGDVALGNIFLRYRGLLRLAERWAVAAPQTASGTPQRVRIFPAHEDSRGGTQMFLLRARQLEMQRRRLRLRGTGREFESMRDYAHGDELRNISWSATARRGKLVTRQFTVERSQKVWVVVDAGRLSRTALELRQTGQQLEHETDAEHERRHTLTVTQLDGAATAATMLAQVVNGSGDKFALLTYGRAVQQLLMPGKGATHLRLWIDLLSQTRSEPAEADHLQAVARLKSLQQSRGLIVWMTELIDTAGRPELITAAADLTRRHLVLLVLLVHPELEQLAAQTPGTREEMFRVAAAQEMLERRREAVAQLERSGVLIVQTTAAEAGARAINSYLEIKARGKL